MKNLNKETLRVLFEALVDGDGRTTNDYVSGHYYTISKQLADDVSEIALKLGYVVYIYSRQRKNRRGLSYAVAFKTITYGGTEILTGNHLYDVNTVTKRKTNIQRENYSGKTYCLGIPKTHTFIIKQKGSVWVSGNSWVKQRFITEGEKEGRLFIPASLWDNPYLDREEYVQSLMNLDPITRAQLLNGDWTAREAGSVFRREWFSYVTSIPNKLTGCRFWDLAATAPKTGTDPDYTCGVLLGTKDGIYYIVDVVRFRGTPADVEKKIKQTAIVDRDRPEFRSIEIRIEEEKGQAGISLASHYSRNVLKGFNFRSHKITGDKEVRASPPSASAEMGNMAIVTGSTWLTDFLDELESFPQGSHDDQCFVAGTKIMTDCGEKPIETIVLGDSVLTRNGYQKVIGCGVTGIKPVFGLTLNNGFSIKATGNHPIFVEGKGYVALSTITGVDKICTLHQLSLHVPKYVAVSSVHRLIEPEIVYNLSIENNHEYFANGILVHNCDALSGAHNVLSEIPNKPISISFGRRPS